MRGFLLALLIWSAPLHATQVISETTLDEFPPRAPGTVLATTEVQTGRLALAGDGSNCASAKPNPGLGIIIGTYRVDRYRVTAMEDGCLTFLLTGEAGLFAVVYDDRGLDVADPSAHYLGDSGEATDEFMTPVQLSIPVEAGETYHFAVTTVGAGKVGDQYQVIFGGVPLRREFFDVHDISSVTPPGTTWATSSTAVLQSGRLNRVDPPSTCAGAKPFPGVFSTNGTHRTHTYRFVPQSSGCAVVSVWIESVLAHAVLYTGDSYQPGMPEVGYLADAGVIPARNQQNFALPVQKGQPLTLVVSEVVPGSTGFDRTFVAVHDVALAHEFTIVSTLDTLAPSAHPDWTSTSEETTQSLEPMAPASECGQVKPLPPLETDAPGLRRFDAYTFVPTGSGCVEIEIISLSETVFAAAYDANGFEPTDVRSNFLGDSQFPTVRNRNHTSVMAIDVTAGEPFTVVVHATLPATPAIDYRLRLKGQPLLTLGDGLFLDGFETF